MIEIMSKPHFTEGGKRKKASQISTIYRTAWENIIYLYDLYTAECTVYLVYAMSK